jgi:molecular chaperone DnaJ
MRNYYEILGVSKDATDAEIKQAYRKLSRVKHPDKSSKSKEVATREFQELSQANAVLSDPEKRRIYDMYGEEGLNAGLGCGGDEAGGGGGSGGGGFPMGGFPMGGFPFPGSEQKDNIIELELSYEELFTGGVYKVTSQMEKHCDECEGTGFEDKREHKCTKCDGSGIFTVKRGPGIFRSTCQTCSGTGVDNRAKKCNVKGCIRGTVHYNNETDVTVPAGAYEGVGIRIGRNNVVGIKEKEHPLYKRGFEGDPSHLELTINISYAESICGFARTFVGIDGVEFNFMQTDSVLQGQIFKIDGLGMPILQRGARGGEMGRGALFVKIHIANPPHLSAEERETLRSMFNLPEQKIKETAATPTKELYIQPERPPEEHPRGSGPECVIA